MILNQNPGANINFFATLISYDLAIIICFDDAPLTKKGILYKTVDFVLTMAFIFLVCSLVYMIPNMEIAYVFYIFIPVTVFTHALLFRRNQKVAISLYSALNLSSFLIVVFRLSLDIGFLYDLTFEDAFFVIPLTLIAAVVVRKFEIKEINKIMMPYLIVQCLICFLIVTTVIIFTSTIHDASMIIYTVYIMSFLYIIALISYFFLYKLTDFYFDSLRSHLMNMKTEDDMKLIKVAQDNVETIKKMRHDLKNHYQLLHVFLQNKDYDKLNEYFSDLWESSFAPLAHIDCGNDIISAVLNMEMGKAQSHGIKVNSHIIVKKKLNIADADLSRFIFNIIDNAIKAILKEEIKDAVIDVSITCHDEYVVFEISNPTIETEVKTIEKRMAAGGGQSNANPDGNNMLHGFGHLIIEDVVKKYDGEISYSIEDSKFIVLSMLKEKGEEENVR